MNINLEKKKFRLFQDTLDMFGNAVVSGVKGGLQQTYIESMRSIVLPAYEKANAELFKQLYDTFNKGTIACKIHFDIINSDYIIRIERY